MKKPLSLLTLMALTALLSTATCPTTDCVWISGNDGCRGFVGRLHFMDRFGKPGHLLNHHRLNHTI